MLRTNATDDQHRSHLGPWRMQIQHSPSSLQIQTWRLRAYCWRPGLQLLPRLHCCFHCWQHCLSALPAWHPQVHTAPADPCCVQQGWSSAPKCQEAIWLPCHDQCRKPAGMETRYLCSDTSRAVTLESIKQVMAFNHNMSA